ncbi:MAG: diguanylate cyclase, partial [Alphaproteobacteria bacterium]
MAEPAADPAVDRLADRPPALPPDPSFRRFLRNLPLPASIPVLALIAGCGLSVLAMLQSDRLLTREEEHRFATRVEEIHGQLADRLQVYQQVTRSAASLVMTFPDLHWTQW